MRLCKNCKYYKSFKNNDDRCYHPKLMRYDYVNGESLHTYCATQRVTSFGCGPNARYFEDINDSKTESDHNPFKELLKRFGVIV